MSDEFIETVEYTPAFPTSMVASTFFGMTLRDYFAAKALNGILAATSGIHNVNATKETCEQTKLDPLSMYAQMAYEHADAMLYARSITKEPLK